MKARTVYVQFSGVITRFRYVRETPKHITVRWIRRGRAYAGPVRFERERVFDTFEACRLAWLAALCVREKASLLEYESCRDLRLHVAALKEKP